MKGEPKFLVDGMLGSLARWLRMLGYDVAYEAEKADEELLRLAAETGRILLTSDVELYRRACRRTLEAFLVKGRKDESLLWLSRRYGLRLTLKPEFSRCPLCNTPLRRVRRREVQGLVPPLVFKRKRGFWICPNPKCGKVYWRGSHWNKIKETLRKLSNGGRKAGRLSA